MIFLVWILNFGISWLNAWGCGKTWNETKANGGMPHFMNWMGAIMSASGFTWCYMVVAALLGTVIPIKGDDGQYHALLTPEMLKAFCDLGYLAIILPILGSGLAITIHSWGVFWRRRNFSSGATAGWNTFAQVYNFYGAARHIPEAGLGVKDFFGGKDSDKSKLIVILLVVGSIIGGILTTRAIIRSVAKNTAFNRGVFYRNREEAEAA